ncbi:hypothetical protein EVA_08598 [gut metagenome]|uniref:Uncharacterized protein n=1 Tax=gut metagenome TaxID=749906 RepID=J9G7S0_9ZZZZ
MLFAFDRLERTRMLKKPSPDRGENTEDRENDKNHKFLKGPHPLQVVAVEKQKSPEAGQHHQPELEHFGRFDIGKADPVRDGHRKSEGTDKHPADPKHFADIVFKSHDRILHSKE